jgi:hypothetical protein
MNSFRINRGAIASKEYRNVMKSLFLICSLFFFGSACAQPLVKIYGFSQLFTPGMIPTDMNDEKGRAKRPRTNTNYYIYLSLPAKETIKVNEMRIGQQWYKLLGATSVKTPVYIEQPVKKLVVAATLNKVLELQKGDSSATVRNLLLTKDLANAELIVSYTWKGKTFYISKQKITVLEPVHGL